MPSSATTIKASQAPLQHVGVTIKWQLILRTGERAGVGQQWNTLECGDLPLPHLLCHMKQVQHSWKHAGDHSSNVVQMSQRTPTRVNDLELQTRLRCRRI